MAADYASFIHGKSQLDSNDGFAATWMPEQAFDFQCALIEWALLKGRAAIFADCGMGKGICQLAWAENVARHTGGRVLILAPLAVVSQTVAEGARFGIEAHRSVAGEGNARIVVTNYERLHHFDPAAFAGVVCDESGILKSFDGATKAAVTEFMRTRPYRLLCTATAAPNDYVELGTSSEALGYLGHMDMLHRFFKNDKNTVDTRGHWKGHAAPRAYEVPHWRFKGHAEEAFWRWVCSWARSLRKPSDLGFADGAFVLPPLTERDHMVTASAPREGQLFSLPAVGLAEEREERRRTLTERCETAAQLVEAHDYSMLWCNLNDEGDLLEKLIPQSIQVEGADSDEYKLAAVDWFLGSRCICDDPMFSDRVTAWRSDPRGIGNSGTPTTVSSESPRPSRTRKNIPRSDAPTSPLTTWPTSTSTDGAPESSATPTTQSDAPSTRATQHSAPLTSRRSSDVGPLVPAVDSMGRCGDTGSLPTTTTERSRPKVGDAESADEWTTVTGVAVGSTSTTATQPERSADSFAAGATSDSDSSVTTPTGSSVPPCICGHASGPRRLISKARILGFGLNLQHCAHVVSFATHSFEQDYQSVRRCWRFGQTRPVTVDRVLSDGETRVTANRQRKAAQAEAMFAELVRNMQQAQTIDGRRYFTKTETVPSWL